MKISVANININKTTNNNKYQKKKNREDSTTRSENCFVWSDGVCVCMSFFHDYDIHANIFCCISDVHMFTNTLNFNTYFLFYFNEFCTYDWIQLCFFK